MRGTEYGSHMHRGLAYYGFPTMFRKEWRMEDMYHLTPSPSTSRNGNGWFMLQWRYSLLFNIYKKCEYHKSYHSSHLLCSYLFSRVWYMHVSVMCLVCFVHFFTSPGRPGAAQAMPLKVWHDFLMGRVPVPQPKMLSAQGFFLDRVLCYPYHHNSRITPLHPPDPGSAEVGLCHIPFTRGLLGVERSMFLHYISQWSEAHFI